MHLTSNVSRGSRTSQLLVIGNGVAGLSSIEQILQARTGVEVTMFGSGTPVHDLEWYQRNGVGVQLGVRVTEIDPGGKTVTADDGSITPYDNLLIAVGSAPYVPAILGLKKRNVLVARTFDELRDVNLDFGHGARVVVISESLPGAELAAEIRERGSAVTLIVDAEAAAVEQNVDLACVRHLTRMAEQRGVTVLNGRRVSAVVGNGCVQCVDLDDSSELPADIVVITSSTRPDVELARRAGLNVNRGIVVDDRLRTSAPDIFAVGECAEHRHVVYGPLSALLEQARVVAAQIVGREDVLYEGSVQAFTARVLGIDFYSAGAVDESRLPGVEVVRYEDPGLGIYRKLLLKDNRLVGVILMGDVTGGETFLEWLKNRTDLSSVRRSILLAGAAAV